MHITVIDNNKINCDFDEAYINDIILLSEIMLKDNNENNIFLFKSPLKEKFKDRKIFEFNKQNNSIKTSNIAGFIGINNTSISIKSRFSQNDTNDYFLHYMLLKVLNIHMANLHHNIDNDKTFSFLPYLFNFYLKNAYSLGLFKQYVRKEYNDSKIRGNIDFSRHIKYNFMENGNVAYNVREHSYDNALNQLIRHTIEYINENKKYLFILESKDIKEIVKVIREITPTYSKKNRNIIINKNIKSRIHPYYTAYEPLRKICIKILKNEQLKYGQSKDKVYGILFDLSYLWEEYLNTLLKPLHFTHPNNTYSKDAVKILTVSPNWHSYPDFYNDKIVLDAKYKKLNNMDSVDYADRHQILSYMYILGLKNSLFIHPIVEEKECITATLNSSKNNLLYNYSVGIYNFLVPQNISTMQEFIDNIKISEEKFKTYMKQYI